jgi:hypothetical protein
MCIRATYRGPPIPEMTKAPAEAGAFARPPKTGIGYFSELLIEA